MATEPTQEQIDKLYLRLKSEAEAGGYHLHPDIGFTKDLIKGLLVNGARYGYWNCPCRLTSGVKADDLDIICPCDYRDPDLDQYGACYCALYVSAAIAAGKEEAKPIPERRPTKEVRQKMKEEAEQKRSRPNSVSRSGAAKFAATSAPGNIRPRSARSAKSRRNASKGSCN